MGGYGMRGGYGGMPAPGMPQMAYGYPQQGQPMAAHPQVYAAQQQYGRGGYPPQQSMGYNTMPQQGTSTSIRAAASHNCRRSFLSLIEYRKINMRCD